MVVTKILQTPGLELIKVVADGFPWEGTWISHGKFPIGTIKWNHHLCYTYSLFFITINNIADFLSGYSVRSCPGLFTMMIPCATNCNHTAPAISIDNDSHLQSFLQLQQLINQSNIPMATGNWHQWQDNAQSNHTVNYTSDTCADSKFSGDCRCTNDTERYPFAVEVDEFGDQT